MAAGILAINGVCFDLLMRWQPDADPCPECGFSWDISAEEGMSIVSGSPSRITGVVEGADGVTRRPAPGVWSPNSYLWHLVDVLRIGGERLLTASLDPAAGIPCWDENALAEVRRYDSLSPRVGVVAYEAAVMQWLAVARSVAGDASVEHPEFGTLTAADIIRRNAHEVRHHELDIRRGVTRQRTSSAGMTGWMSRSDAAEPRSAE